MRVSRQTSENKCVLSGPVEARYEQLCFFKEPKPTLPEELEPEGARLGHPVLRWGPVTLWVLTRPVLTHFVLTRPVLT